MSFIEQERALFDLLFDSQLRKRFSINQSACLYDYELDDNELSDFDRIRVPALELDATMRTSMALSYIGKFYPLSFGLVSSLPQGIDHLRSLIKPDLMRESQTDRVVTFGKTLKQSLSHYAFAHDLAKQIVMNILECELSMCVTAQACINHHLSHPTSTTEQSIPDDWINQPISLAPFLSAHLLPLPYDLLMDLLCPSGKAMAWRTLQQQPLDATIIDELIAQQEHSLIVVRAHIEHPSTCDPSVMHKTVFLSPGFGNLLQYVNGQMSVQDLLNAMQDAGAEEKVLTGMKEGFHQLLLNEMCTV